MYVRPNILATTYVGHLPVHSPHCFIGGRFCSYHTYYHHDTNIATNCDIQRTVIKGEHLTTCGRGYDCFYAAFRDREWAQQTCGTRLLLPPRYKQV